MKHWLLICLLLLAGPLQAQTGSSSNVTASAVAPDAPDPAYVVSTAPASFTSNTALATITGLSITLTGGKTYVCQGHLTITASGAAGGVKAALGSGGGSLSATSSSFTYTFANGTTINNKATTTSLGVAGNTAVETDIDVNGAIVVNAGGPLVFQAAQNVSDPTTLTVGINSWLSCKRVS